MNMAKKSLVKKAPKETSTSTPESVVAFDAKDLARKAVLEQAEKQHHVGGFVSVEFDDDNRVATYLFESNLPGYKGWRWCVTRCITCTRLDSLSRSHPTWRCWRRRHCSKFIR
jgi:hypothetical protein